MDSARYRHPYFVKKPDFQESTTDLRGNGAQRGKVTVVDLAAKKDSDQRDYEKRLKTIEVRTQIVLKFAARKRIQSHLWLV